MSEIVCNTFSFDFTILKIVKVLFFNIHVNASWKLVFVLSSLVIRETLIAFNLHSKIDYSSSSLFNISYEKVSF
jgi:hypothetical protein